MSADIDIDFGNRDKALALIKHTAARLQSGQRHNSGIYVTNIPRDPINNCATIAYETAEQLGYFKLDFLNMGVYELVRDTDHYNDMLQKEPPWHRLWTDTTWTSKLVHIGNYTGLLNDMRPDSIPRMAAFISIIRPGKAHLQRRPWDEVFSSVWDGNNSQGFVFKKSHAISYAMLVSLHMNLVDLLD